MALVQGICNSFKDECFQGIHDLDNDAIKIALYNSNATLNLSTTAYTATEEVSGTGYTAGGQVMPASVTLDGTVAVVDFDDVSWTSASISDIRGALIYNSSKANRAICVLDFGNSYNVINGTFLITWPAPTNLTGILRFN